VDLHSKTENRETLEHYVKGDLAVADRHYLEEHLIECPECFESVKEMERFAAGVRRSAAEGLLEPKPAWRPWLSPAFGALAVVAAGLLGYALWSLDGMRNQRDLLARQLHDAKSRLLDRPAPEFRTGNLPVLIFHAAPPGEVQRLAVGPADHELALWFPGAAADATYTLVITNPADNVLLEAHGLKANAYNAVTVVLPAEKLPPAHYVIRLYNSERQIVSQYMLRIVRP
jgi:anti-sigma factor RsiW